MELTLILTEDCNLRCAYCYQPAFRKTAMPVEIAVRAVEAAVAHGADSVALTFFGGEPLLRAPAMFEILGEAREIGRRTGVPVTAKVATNGVLLDEETIRRAGECGLFVSLSMDGTAEAHDAGRRHADGEGSFAAADAALRRLVAAGLPFAVYSVVTPANVRHLEASARYLWRAGARILVSAIDYSAAWDASSLRTLRRQFGRLGKFYRERLRKRERFHLEPFDSRISQRTRAGDWSRCAPGVHQVTVAPDGTLYGCIEYFHRRLLPLGTVDEWLRPGGVRELNRAKRGAPEECGDCGVRGRCNRTCACVNLRGTGRANRPPASLCETERVTILAADEVASSLFRRKVPEFLVRQYSSCHHVLSGVEALLEEMETIDE